MLDIKQFVTEIKNGVAQEALRLRQESGVVPKLVVIRVGDDPASEIYVSNKVRTSLELGLLSEQIIYPAETPASALLVKLAELNSDDSVDGILVQSPLPPHIDEQTIVKSIGPKKDVDGFHPVNVGLLSLG